MTRDTIVGRSGLARLALAVGLGLVFQAVNAQHHAAAPHGDTRHDDGQHDPAAHATMDHEPVTDDPVMRPERRDPHAYSNGYDFGDLPRQRLADEHRFGMLLVDRLEQVISDDNTSTAFDMQGWYGRDYDRVMFKAEGHVDDASLEEASMELLWSHALTSFWNTQAGIRYDIGDAPDRGWLAVGLQGLAPYWFEVDVTAYLGEGGQTAFSLEAEYDLFLTQRLILQPRLEATAYGRTEADRGLGSGLSDLSVGMRLQYQLRREFTVYGGVEWAGRFGGTRDLLADTGIGTEESRLVAGLRFWF